MIQKQIRVIYSITNNSQTSKDDFRLNVGGPMEEESIMKEVVGLVMHKSKIQNPNEISITLKL